MLNTLICGRCSFHGFCRRRNNPYSSRGLDKLSALVADHKQKRLRIYSQLGPGEDAPLVRFVYSSSDECVPIIVTKKGAEESKNEENQETESRLQRSNYKDGKRRSLSWRRPECYFPAAVILILVFLAVFGRSAAVMCTAVVWYSIPILAKTELKVNEEEKC